jgi:hypothetical protein
MNHRLTRVGSVERRVMLGNPLHRLTLGESGGMHGT